MKKLILPAILMIALVSCKKEVVVEEVVPTIPEKEVTEIPVSEECYLGIMKKDTVSLKLEIKGDQVISGNMSTKYYQKDKNEGTLYGEMKGDTLYADYTFTSEGILSVRQVAFLKKGDTFVEGFGEVVGDKKGKVNFKDKKALKFDNSTVLKKVDCKM